MGKNFENVLECPVTRTIQFIGGRWKPIILYCLTGGTKRFGQLDALIPDISRKVLTQQVMELVADGLVHREEFKEIPPRVEYSLTEIGKSVVPILDAMCKWGSTVALKLEDN